MGPEHAAMLDRLDEFDHPFEVNEHGVWCLACGELIAAPWNVTDTWRPPENCRACGFPDEMTE